MDIDGLTTKEIRACIITFLEEKGIQHEMISISVVDGPKVLLSGEVYSESHRDELVAAIIEATNITKIINSIEVVPNEPSEDGDVFDDDHECMGTGDMSKAVEDGLPYIPPADGWSFDEEK